MAVVPTALTVTPIFDGTKRMTAVGTVAVNEHVALTVVGVADGVTGLVLRLVSQCGRVEYARFPMDTGDTWTVSGANVTATLRLNTPALARLFLCAAANETREVDIELGNGVTSNLYGTARLVIRNWMQNPLDPVAGSSQLQAQIDTLAGRIENHQHDADEEGESAFPHNNLTDRDVAGVHPILEAAVGNAVLAAGNASSAAATAASNAQTALTAATAALALKPILQDETVLTPLGATYKLPDIKALVNAMVAYLNTIRSAT